MITRNAIPILILALLFLPLPFILSFFFFGVLLAVRPREEPAYARAVIARSAWPTLLRSPPL